MAEQQPDPVPLQYDSAADFPTSGRRPAWVWLIIVIYGLFALVVMLLPIWNLLAGENDAGIFRSAVVASTAFALCGLGLMMTPVRAVRRRRMTRRSIWIPLLASGFLIGILAASAALALIEYRSKALADPDAWANGALIGGGVVWVLWAVVLWLMTRRNDPSLLAARLHRWLFAGSVAELLVAVPTHIVVRRRNECFAGMLTGTAIGVGVAVMFLSVGPGVVMLYFRRWKQTRLPAKQIQSDQS